MKAHDMPPSKPSLTEHYAIWSLASIYAFRMLGLFMILPVFALYAKQVYGAMPILIGLALGIYGLTQASLQIPFGLLSDIVGRKRIILVGLLLFALGSVVAALAHTIEGVIIGRALQGAGAVGSTLTALLADLTREENRTKAMAMIGIAIAIAFCSAMVLGPLLYSWIGVPGIFWLTAVLACGAIVILIVVVPNPRRCVFHSDTQLSTRQLTTIITNSALLRQDLAIFMLHAILTASFIALPLTLSTFSKLPTQQWLIYLPVLLLAFIAMIPFVIIAESKRRMKQVYLTAIITIMVTQFLLWQWHHSILFISLVLLLFFTAFITLEAIIPSLVSKIAPIGLKGTALGVYSTSQFLGIFTGGLLGGLCLHHYGVGGIFIFSAGLALIWLMVAVTMKEPQYLSSYVIAIGHVNKRDAKTLQNQLSRAAGVVEALVDCKEGVAYLKIDKMVATPKAFKTIANATDH